jgi:hypothetical protein
VTVPEVAFLCAQLFSNWPEALIVVSGFAAWAIALIGGDLLLRQFVGDRLSPRAQKAWQAAAKRLDLTTVGQSGGRFEKPWFRLQSGPLLVEMRWYRRLGVPGTRIGVAPRQPGTPKLTVRRKGRASPGSGSELGDPAFSEEFHLEGPAPLALEGLDVETRRELAGLLRGIVQVEEGEPIEVRASLEQGVLVVDVDHTNGMSVPQVGKLVADILRTMLPIAERLIPGRLPDRIVRNLQSETVAGVRVQSVLRLGRDFPQHPAAREALRAACKDPDDEVQLQAALALGEEGVATLLALVARAATDDACAARAVAALGERLPVEQAETALRQALESGHERTAAACIEALGRLGHLDRLDHNAAERVLFTALHSTAPQVVLAATRALGRVGTAAAVVQLRELEPPLWDQELHRAVRQAISEIRSRLTGARAGQLSLLEERGEGALSLVETDPGRLSLTADLPDGSGPEEPTERDDPPAAGVATRTGQTA